MRALVLAPFSHQGLKALERMVPLDYESWTDTLKLTDPEELARRLQDQAISILVVEADFVFEEVFEDAQNLKLVGVCRSSLSHVDLEAATRHGVAVVNTPYRNARAVGELALAFMLALARRLPFLDCYVKTSRWEDPVEGYISHRGVELQGRTLGLVGLGATGRTVARLGQALGMQVLAYDPYTGLLGQRKAGALLTDLNQVLTESHFVSLHAPVTPETEGIIGRKELARMGQGAYLINTASHDLVDQEALVEALKSGALAGAALDVHEAHPIPTTNPLLKLDNVILTPHIGGATGETVERHSAMMVEDIGRFLEGRRPMRLANPKVWRRRRVL